MTRALRRPPARGVEWGVREGHLLPGVLAQRRHQALVERAEHGGWELDRVRITADGTRRVILRRKIIRAVRYRLTAG